MPSRVIVSDPTALVTAFVAHLKGITELTALVPADNIVQYVESENGDLMRTIYDLRRPALLVYIQAIAQHGNPALIRAQVGVAMRVAAPITVYTTLLNGVSTVAGDGLPTITSTILSPWSPMTIPAFERRFIVVDSQRVFDYWEMHAGFTDRNS